MNVNLGGIERLKDGKRRKGQQKNGLNTTIYVKTYSTVEDTAAAACAGEGRGSDGSVRYPMELQHKCSQTCANAEHFHVGRRSNLLKTFVGSSRLQLTAGIGRLVFAYCRAGLAGVCYRERNHYLYNRLVIEMQMW
jgi:hypothetical protein